MTRTWTEAQHEWMRIHYGRSDIHETTAALNAEFGTAHTERAVYQKAHKLGLGRPVLSRGGARDRRCETRIDWSANPDMAEFMLANDHGSVPAIIAKFRERFGVRLSGPQVTGFRMAHGTQSKLSDAARRKRASHCPVGTERDTGKGYVLVKVAELPRAPGTRDNWRMKHVLIWERANGRPLPAGHVVMFADGDHSNFSPDNLVAVPKRLIGIMNGPGMPDWWDAESLRACAAVADLQNSIMDARMRPRKCELCGKEFVPRSRSAAGSRTRTCPECVDSGHKASDGGRWTVAMTRWAREYYPGHGIEATLAAWPFEWKPTASTLQTMMSRLGIKRERREP